MRVKVLCHYTPSWKEIADITTPVLQAYCNKHGYVMSAYECTAYQQYNGKEKLKHILQELELGDVAMVIDADAIVTNMDVTIESFIDSEHDFYVTKHVGHVNCGVFLVRLTPWSINLLLDLQDNIGKERIYCEQDALIQYMREHPQDKKIKIVPHPAFNSLKYEHYPEHKNIVGMPEDWNEKSFIMHLPGLSMSKRKELLTNTPVIL
jgi:hypothetical protein